MNKRGQLFLIEVIIALSVLIILVTALFAAQSFSPAVTDSTLQEKGEEAINLLVVSGDLDTYLDVANRSFYVYREDVIQQINVTKVQVVSTIDSVLPIIANYKVHTETYNTTTGDWDQIDIINFELNTPSGSEIVVVEYYTPGIFGVFQEFRFRLSLWYEVEVA